MSRASGMTSSFPFMVRGEAIILEVDRSSRVGLAPMDLAPLDGEADIFLAIGPVLRGNALRDSFDTQTRTFGKISIRRLDPQRLLKQIIVSHPHRYQGGGMGQPFGCNP